MKYLSLTFKALVSVVLVLGNVFGNISMVFGHDRGEEEPNHPCPTAQDFGAVALPFAVDGSLDSTFGSPDVDFFKFTGTPGAFVRVDLEGDPTGKGTLDDPLLGLFDSACNLIESNDDTGTLNSRLVFAIPADRVFILAATSFPDGGFIGGGVGTYQLTITRLAAIESISGRVVDAVTGDSLPGDAAPFAAVQLVRCEDFACFVVNAQDADTQGRFQFSVDGSGRPLEVGTYQVEAFAEQYQSGRTEFFPIAEGESRDVGDVPLQPLPVQFSNIAPCEDVPTEGGRCQYSVRVTNGLTTPLDGQAWSLVNGSQLGSFLSFTVFQVQPQPVRLAPQESTDVRFEFQVPGDVRDGASICADVFVGRHPDIFFDTLGATFLFCISKGATEFSVMPQKKARQMFQQLKGRTSIPSKKK
jgi:hypothetical protein